MTPASGEAVTSGLESLINRFAYYPEPDWIATPAQFGLDAEDVYLAPEEGVQIHAWFFPLRAGGTSSGRAWPVATMLFCHGNAGNVSHRLDNVARLLDVGFQVLLFDYRGYGHSTGQPSEAGLYRDAHAAWNYLVARPETGSAPRVIFGRSLGGAVAVELAAEQSRRPDTIACADGLILESTFTSFQTLARLVLPVRLPRLPVKYDSLSKISRIAMPVLVVHGEYDELIPFDDGRALFEAAPQPKWWYPIRGAGHNDTYLLGGEAYFQRLAAFAQDLPLP